MADNFVIVLPCNWQQYEFRYGELHVLDCSEDVDGADIVKYTCPVCAQQHESRVYGR